MVFSGCKLIDGFIELNFLTFPSVSHYSRLDLMCEREENRAEELETSLVLADSWKKQGDELLYSMIPRTVADKIRSGQDPMGTCQTFEEGLKAVKSLLDNISYYP